MAEARHGRPEILDETPMRFAQAHAAFTSSSGIPTAIPTEIPTGIPTGLTPAERRVLRGWIETARQGGIETAEDLGFRPWPGRGGETIIGVFRSGHLLASWLLVGQSGAWAVASCGDGVVSSRLGSLEDALELVYPRSAPPRH